MLRAKADRADCRLRLRVRGLVTTARGAAVELLETLGPEQRDAIRAHHLEDRGYAEIAAELRCSESVIRKRVSRGLAALQSQLGNGEA